MSQAISVRLPEELTEGLARVAKAVDRPKTFLVRKAIEAYLSEYADYQIALDRLRDKTDPIVSSAELKKKLCL